ncbi:hypothetical protein ACFVZ2_28215, partial [Streptomyces lasiicapitis]
MLWKVWVRPWWWRVTVVGWATVVVPAGGGRPPPPAAAAPDARDARALARPAGERVAVVDTRVVGHVHALRLGLTDPRFPVSAVPGAVTAQAGARGELTTVLRTAVGATADGGGASVALAPEQSERAEPSLAGAHDQAVPDRIAAALEGAGLVWDRPALGPPGPARSRAPRVPHTR